MKYSIYHLDVTGKDWGYFSPPTGAEMARSPSGSSSASHGSYDAVLPWGSSASPGDNAPNSPGEGITNEFSYLGVSANNGGHETSNIEYTETSNDHYELPASYQAPVQGDAESSQGHPWYQYYDFIANVEQGQPPYWQLKAGYTANEEYPMYRPCPDSEITQPSAPLNICLRPGCNSKPFKRKADLDRHYQQVHWDSSIKPSFPCDYTRCTRFTKPFFRADHYRDHCRDYHREDLLRRSPSKKETNEWWADRIIHKKWWRCSKCLQRVYIQQHGFECHNCKTPCEPQRRNYRINK
ncbi:hypothetical protein DL771_000225 [Monosporascus sp. 5C6A]|nr:hypothetical protein DL771_000225 [Monosporascus sp. 5C6A]